MVIANMFLCFFKYIQCVKGLTVVWCAIKSNLEAVGEQITAITVGINSKSSATYANQMYEQKCIIIVINESGAV